VPWTAASGGRKEREAREMEHTIGPMDAGDGDRVMEIFNHYVEHSFAAFPENPLPPRAFEMFLQMSAGLPALAARDGSGNMIGFGMLRRHSPIPAFAHTADVSYFIAPEHTGKGLGRELLEGLEAEGREKGIAVILAEISSLNEGSIRFHARNGFVECGRFPGVGRKHGRIFDVVWMQKSLGKP